VTIRTYSWLCCAVSAVAVLHARDALAQGALCVGNLDDERVRGNLNVTSRCQLTDTDVRGDVILFAGGSLVARGARIRGNIEGNRADFVDLDRVRVDGNVGLQELVGDSSRIERSDIRGQAVLTNNRSRFEILNNELRRDLRAFGNTGGLLISGNSIDRDLECSANVPAPTVFGNRVDGDAEGQCADVRAQPPPSARPPATAPPPAASPPSAAPPQPPDPHPPAAPPPSPPAPAPPPAAPPPPPATPAPSAATPPAVTPPAANPPAAAPPSATPPATETVPLDDGGAGAIGWPIAVLLPFIAWRRFRRGAPARRQAG
jgi:hypothetical protein